MLLWIVFACLTTATLAVVLRPLLSPIAKIDPGGSGHAVSSPPLLMRAPLTRPPQKRAPPMPPTLRSTAIS